MKLSVSLGFFPTSGLMAAFNWQRGTEKTEEEKTEEVKEELQNSFIRHATDEMQEYTRETERENSKAKKRKEKKKKEAENQVAPPVLLENNSFFNCASSGRYQNLTLEPYKSLDFAEKIYITFTSEQKASCKRSAGYFFFFKERIFSTYP